MVVCKGRPLAWAPEGVLASRRVSWRVADRGQVDKVRSERIKGEACLS